MYGCGLGLSEKPAHIFNDFRIGLDKLTQFPVRRRLHEQPRPVRTVIYHGCDIVHDGMRYAVHTRHILQCCLELHGRKGSSREYTLAAIHIVTFFQIVLDLLPPVGSVIDIDIGQGRVSAFRQPSVNERIHDSQRGIRFPDFNVSHFHLIYFLYRTMALTVWRLTPYCFARVFCEALPEKYFTRISSACAFVSLAFTLFSP